MKKIILCLPVLVLLSACTTIENNNADEPKVKYEKEYVLGRLAPVKKEMRPSDVKEIDKDDMKDMMKRVGTPLDPLKVK